MNCVLLRWGRNIAVVATILLASSMAQAVDVNYSEALDQLGLGCYVQGGKLPNGSVSDWWYGCTPTAAGMIMGYYDRNGYAGLRYDNLVPGGIAETNVVGKNGPLGGDAPLLKQAIASTGYQRDFYSASSIGYNTGGGTVALGYGKSKDDQTISHSFDCLADFMGTSQDAIGNANGSTTFYTFDNGAPLTAQQALDYGIWSKDGMYGIKEYINNQGYSVGMNDIYTQPTDNKGLTYGFTFAQYKAEIDAGRPVMIQVDGHSMMGFGYEPNSTTIDMRNTWDATIAQMQWGGSYEGMTMWGVTAFTVQGGSIPTPEAGTTMLLLSFGCSGLLIFRRRA